MPYNKLNFTNISISNAKKIEFKLNLLFYNIHVQHDNQKIWHRKTTVYIQADPFNWISDLISY